MRRLNASVPAVFVATFALALGGHSTPGTYLATGVDCSVRESALQRSWSTAGRVFDLFSFPAGWYFESAGQTAYRDRYVTRFELIALGRRVESTGVVVSVSPDCHTTESIIGRASIDALTSMGDLSARQVLDPETLASVAGDVYSASVVRHLYSAIEVQTPAVYFIDYFEAGENVVAIDAELGLVHRSGYALGHGSWLPPDGGPGARLTTTNRLEASALRGSVAFSKAEAEADATVDGRRLVPFVTGTGSAFLSDPSVGEPVSVAVPRLHAGGERLDGKFLRVSSWLLDEGLPTAESGPGASYFFEPNTDDAALCYDAIENCTRFDNVNAYIHIDRFAQEFWTERLGHNIDFQATVMTHSAADRSTARGDTINVGWGGLFLRNNAYEDELLYHEYSHVVMTRLGFVVNLASLNETRSVNEGYADYFALSYLDQPVFANWATKCPPRADCPGPADDTEIRTLATDPKVWNWSGDFTSDSLRYGVCTRWHPGDFKCKTSWATWEPIYIGAMIWGSALWDVRTALGSDLADELIFASLVESGGVLTNPSIAAGAIMRADDELYGGTHLISLRDLFIARGISPSFSPVGIDGQGDAAARDLLPLEAYPSPFDDEVTIEFELTTPAEAWATVFDLTGRRRHRIRVDGTAGPNVRTLDLEFLATGFYVLTVDTPGKTSSVTLIRR